MLLWLAVSGMKIACTTVFCFDVLTLDQFSMKKPLFTILVSTLIALAATNAQAVTVLYTGATGDATGGGNFGGLGMAPTESFESYTIGTTPASFVGGGFVQASSSDSNYAQPPGAGQFFSLPKTLSTVPQDAGPTYSTIWTPGVTSTKFGIYWGSPDASNTIEFLKADGSSLGSFSVPGTPTYGYNYASTYYVFDAGGQFSSVRFSSEVVAFEFDNLAVDNVSAVPEPGEWAMMLSGLGVVGLIARRRKAASKKQS